MPRRHFPIRCRLDGADTYFLWFSDDSDGVVLAADGSVRAFQTLADLADDASRCGLEIEDEEPVDLDLDTLGRWLDRPDAGTIDCRRFLDCWNLFDDIAGSRECESFQQSSQAAGVVYDKLFWGNNLPSVTPPGERYVPTWSDREVDLLHQILSDGMALTREAIRTPA